MLPLEKEEVKRNSAKKIEKNNVIKDREEQCHQI